MLGPLRGDELSGHRVASFTQRTTDRLSTSRSTSNSAALLRSRASSARSSAVNPPTRSAAS